MTRAGFWVAVAVMCAALTGARAAAPAVPSGRLEVTVQIGGGGGPRLPAAGATVVAARADDPQHARTAVAGTDGRAIFTEFPAADNIALAATYEGLRVARGGVRVVAGRTARVEMLVLRETAEVTVTGRGKPVELESGGRSETKLDAESLADLPVAGREYQQVLTLAPGVQDADGDGNPNVHGSRARDFRMELDGVSNVDPLTGQFMSNVNPDAIEEIEVVDSGADASYGGAVGGFGRIVTKSGTNRHALTFNLFARDSLFDSDGAGGQEPLRFSLIQPSVFLSGPVWRDRMWYVVSHEWLDERTPVHVLAGSAFVETRRRLLSFDKLTWQITPHDRLSLQYSADPLRLFPAYANSLTPPSSAARVASGGPTVSLKWTSARSATAFWDTTAAWSSTGLNVSPYDEYARNSCNIPVPIFNADGSPDNRVGREFCLMQATQQRSGRYYQTYADDRRRLTLRGDGELYVTGPRAGAHRIKGGLLVERNDFSRDLHVDNTFTMSDIAPQKINPDNSDTGGTGGTPGTYNTLLTASRFYPQFKSSTARGDRYALYLSDTWEPRPNLAITAGVRVSRESIRADGYAPFNPAKEREEWSASAAPCIRNSLHSVNVCLNREAWRLTAYAVDDPYVMEYPSCDLSPNPAVCARLRDIREQAGLHPTFRRPEKIEVTNTNPAPRLSVSWDPWSDGKTKVAAAWGRYYGDLFLLPFVLESGPDSTTQAFAYSENSPQLWSRRLESGFTINAVDRNMRSPRNDEWSLSLEREIAPETALRVRYLERAYRNELQDVDINHVPVYLDRLTRNQRLLYTLDSGRFTCRTVGRYADCTGQMLVDPETGQIYDGPDGVPDLQVLSPNFNNILKIGNYNESDYRALIVELTRRYFHGWEASASYTWSQSMGQAEDFNQGLGNDITLHDDERGPLATDQRHVVKIRARKLLHVWGGMHLGAVAEYQTGLPYSIVWVRDVADFPTDLTGGVLGPLNPRQSPLIYFRTARFISRRTTYPTGQRNDERNPDSWTLSTSLQKEIHFGRVRMMLEFDIFNLFNNNPLTIAEVSRTTYWDDAINASRTTDAVVAQRRFGRQFQLAIKLDL